MPARSLATIAICSALGTALALAPATSASGPAAGISARDVDATVRLRTIARLSPGDTEITLRDVARLSADVDAAIGGLLIAEATDGDHEHLVRPDDVRAALAEAGGHPARILVQGAAVNVRLGHERASAGRPLAMTAVRIDAGRTVTRRSRSGADGTTPEDAQAIQFVDAARSMPGNDVLAAATHRFLTALDVHPTELRIGVDREDRSWVDRAMNSVHLRLLDAPTDAEVRLEIRPRATARATNPLEGGRIVVLRPQLRVERVRTSEAVDAGVRFEPGMLAAETVWVNPRVAARAVPLDDIVGLESDRRLTEGRLIGPGDVLRPLVVRRGDQLVIRVGEGSYQLQVDVVAQEDGRIGDRIRVRRSGQDAELLAVVVGAGLVSPAAPAPTPAAAADPRQIARR